MNPLSSRALKQTAAQRLSEASYCPRKLIALHTGISLAVSLAVAFIDIFLSQQIDNTGGLAGIGLRSSLSTVQSGLLLAVAIVLPIWSAGFQRAALCYGRKQPAGPATLLEGFRRFGPVLRLLLLQCLLISLLFMVCTYLGVVIFFMTPAAQPYTEAMLPLMEELSGMDPNFALAEETALALLETLLPAYAIVGVLFVAAAIPVFYRIRLANFAILDDPRVGAVFAIVKSWKLAKHHCLQLFRLDLSFWWFYVLQLLLAAVGYLALFLPELTEGHMILLSLLQAAGQLALFWWAGSHVHTTYALAYDALQEDFLRAATPAVPKKQPWDYS